MARAAVANRQVCDVLVEIVVEVGGDRARVGVVACRPCRPDRFLRNDGAICRNLRCDGRRRNGLREPVDRGGSAARRFARGFGRRRGDSRLLVTGDVVVHPPQDVLAASRVRRVDSPANTTFSSATMRGMICSTTSLPLLVIRIDTSRLLVSERVRVTHPRRAACEISREIVGGSRLVAPARSTCRNSPRVASTDEHAPERNRQVMALEARGRETDQSRADAVDEIGQPF